jgi:hypothetical protein
MADRLASSRVGGDVPVTEGSLTPSIRAPVEEESGTNRGRRPARAIRPQREDGRMPDTMQPAPLPSVYQPRVVVRGVSPLIWRRLLIPADTTIAGLHAVLQTAFGWTGRHLHRFVVQGREYGIGHVGGPSFDADPRRVRLGDLGLPPIERFTYHYDFTAGWVP